MNKNYIKEITKILGVKLDEEFNLVGTDNCIHDCSPFHFDKETLRDKNGDACQSIIGFIICGTFIVDKLPWKPTVYGDGYFYIDKDYEGKYVVKEDAWLDDVTDRERYLFGNCFEEFSEAKQNIDKYISYLATKTADVSWRV